MKYTPIEKIDSVLRRALFKGNIVIEIWNYKWDDGKGFLTVNTFELDNCYSEQVTINLCNNDYNRIHRSWGYSYTKAQGKACNQFLTLVREYATTERKFDQVIKLLEYYKEVSDEMFEAMYSRKADMKLYNILQNNF